MMRGKTDNTLREAFYDALGQKNMNLLWHLNETTRSLPVKHVLDVGAGMRVSKNICLPQRAETALVVDSDSQMIRALIEDYQDDRIETVEGKIETADLGETSFDLVFFIMSLPWLDDPEAALLHAISKSPGYFIIANPIISTEQFGKICSGSPEYQEELARIFTKYYNRALDIDAIMQSHEYYPLAVLNSMSWDPTPEHRLRTVLYTKEKPDRRPYEKAKYIIQVNAKCNFNCPDCYVVKGSETMEKEVFQHLIENVRENEMICLRGGEPTLSENLIEDFIHPALDKGICVILESNGSFVGSPRYQDYLKLLTRKNIEIRLSLDREHVDFSFGDTSRTRIDRISKFIDDATPLNIKFGLFALGMCREQVKKFLQEYSVESWLPYIRPLTKYSIISELPIKGKFVDIYGGLHERIVGKAKRMPWDSPFIYSAEA
jgi:organic radical activating enzyme/ubiquinone/menaquinone biosynthesis C-methylase UbiE